MRDYAHCIEILLSMGLNRLRLIINNPIKLSAIEDGGLEVVERVKAVVARHRHDHVLHAHEEEVTLSLARCN